jgi:hypothetical protein
MALNLFNRYGSRANTGDADYPQGSFKNRTAPGAQDGMYVEKDWANDFLGFFQSIISKSGKTPSGTPDTALASQYLDGLRDVALSDKAAISLSNVNVTLNESQYLAPFIELTGTLTGNVQIIVPAKTRGWTFINKTTGAFTITVKTSAGTGVVLPSLTNTIYCDGTNVVANVATAADDSNGTDNSIRIASTGWIKSGFAISLTSNGYIRFPSWLGGLIIQWGTGTTTSGSVIVTLPFAFPKNFFRLVTSQATSSNQTASGGVASGLSQAQLFLTNNSTFTGAVIHYIAIGN